jgi:hypothetical protein
VTFYIIEVFPESTAFLADFLSKEKMLEV